MYVNEEARTTVTPSVTRSIHSRMGDPTGHLLGDLWQDLRYATRTFWKQPAFASATVLTLALGIGATTAIFSVVHGVLLKPLPFQEPERLVSLRQHAPHGAGTNHGPATYLTYRENQKAFEAIGVWDPPRSPLPEAAIRSVFRLCWSALPPCPCCAYSPSSAGCSVPKTIRRALRRECC